MAIIASYNIKGGVGKTAAAVNLAYLAAAEGASTLIWDLDPQGAASYYFRVKPKVKGGGRKVLQGAVEDRIKGTDFPDLDLLPADFSYRHLDLQLDDFKNPDMQLRKLLKPLKTEYDYIFLDCPPGVSLISENILNAADWIIVPTIPTTLSLRTLDQIGDFCEKIGIVSSRVLAFFSMIDLRKKLHRQIVENPPVNTQLLKTCIPYASDVELMGIHRQPVAVFAKNSKASQAYQVLWNEIMSL